MIINNYRVLKESIVEVYKKRSLKFETPANSVSRKFVSDVKYNLSINFTISANGIKNINLIKKFLEEAIKSNIIQPIYSSMVLSNINYINTDTVNLGSDFLYIYKNNDYIMYENDLYTFKIEKILSVDIINGNIILENQITIPEKSKIYIGREMTIDNNISVNKISNTNHRYNITVEEL